MTKITINDITKANWEEAFKLSVDESQQSFVPTIA